MSENETRDSRFLGTYFDRDMVLKVSRWADILAWIVVAVYAIDMVLAVVVLVLQILRGFWQGLGITDMLTNVLYLIERPFRGIVYFVALEGISKALLILMDMEDDMRRAAHK